MPRLNLTAFLLLTLTMLLGAPRAAHAAETYHTCTGFITSLPAVISTQGVWCLNQNLETAITSGNAITIAANNVTLDCNDFKLGGLAAGVGTTADGIYALNRLNATVRHCNIRGFYKGLLFTGSSGGGHAVEDNRFDGNTGAGLQVDGDGSVLRRNRVFDTGGSTVIASAYGIVTAYSVDILDNAVSGVLATSGSNGSAIGIYTVFNPSGSVSGNRVRGLLKDGTGLTSGIYNFGVGRLALRNNDLVGDASTGSVGLTCDSTNPSAKDNVISGFATAITNCTNSGGNTVIP